MTIRLMTGATPGPSRFGLVCTAWLLHSATPGSSRPTVMDFRSDLDCTASLVALWIHRKSAWPAGHRARLERCWRLQKLAPVEGLANQKQLLIALVRLIGLDPKTSPGF